MNADLRKTAYTEQLVSYVRSLRPLVDAPVGIGLQKGAHDAQAEKRKSRPHLRPVGARKTSAK